jgi:hypothetical protein
MAEDLATLALAAIAATRARAGDAWRGEMLAGCVAALRARPAAADARLVRLADALRLDDAALLALALCIAADRTPGIARAVAEAQSPLGGSRPLLGFLASALAPLKADVIGLATGPAVASGLLVVGEEAAALAERSVHVPLPILAALAGRPATLGEARVLAPPALALAARTLAEAARRAEALRLRKGRGLVIRSAAATEAEAVAATVAANWGRRLALVEGTPPAGLVPWLIAGECIPFFAPRLGPGEQWSLPPLGAFAEPWIVAPGLDGAIAAPSAPDEWTLPIPNEAERAHLWLAAGAEPGAARRAAASYRQAAGRIAEAAGRALLVAAREGRAAAGWDDIAAGIAAGSGSLDALARRGHARVGDEALVLPAPLRAGLERLAERAARRERLADGLGPAVTASYRAGVRALFVGESGTGKTLAAHWLATRLGLPLYRVDLAALTSKWIGETEKNLSAVLGAAEHADVLLFFDEADALFGARTDVADAHDRHANAQTNYLLQRIEEFDGIALLASNSRERFDPAFTRRLDAILEFPMPEAPARRELWLAHLGTAHALDAAALDRLAVRVDLAGGHIRGVVLAAAARAGGASIGWADLLGAVREEYAKLGRPAPELDA